MSWPSPCLAGKIDADLLNLFFEARVYEDTLTMKESLP